LVPARERGDLLVLRMEPLDFGWAPKGIVRGIRTIADDAANALDSRCYGDVGKLISNCSRVIAAS